MNKEEIDNIAEDFYPTYYGENDDTPKKAFIEGFSFAKFLLEEEVTFKDNKYYDYFGKEISYLDLFDKYKKEKS